MSGPARPSRLPWTQRKACSGWLPSALGGLRPGAEVGAPWPPHPTVPTRAHVPVVSSKLPPLTHAFLRRPMFSFKSPGVPCVSPQPSADPSAQTTGAHQLCPLSAPHPTRQQHEPGAHRDRWGLFPYVSPTHVLCRTERDVPIPPAPLRPRPLSQALELVNVCGKLCAPAARVQVRPALGQRARGLFSGELATAHSRGGRGLGTPGAAA